MKKKSKILLILLGVLLIGIGLFLQCKDDVQQYFVEQELSAYAPDLNMFAGLEDKIPPLQTTSSIVIGTEKVTQFSQISDLDEPQKTLITTSDDVLDNNTTSRLVSESIPKSQATKKVQRLTTTTVMQNENTNVADESDTYIVEEIQEIPDNDTDDIGWLYLPDTNINYPVMYSGDNDFYLHRTFDGSYLYAGSIFMDGRCSPDFSGTVSILYGHHMNNGSMFADVEKFMNVAYMQSHPYGWIFTPNATYCVQFFFAARVEPTDAIYATGLSQAQRMALLKEKSSVWLETDVSESDKLLMMSTCSTAGKNLRVVVTGKLIQIE
jgi:sortase B